MRFRNTWKRFEEQYLYNLMDCNGRYRVGVHVLQKKGDISSAIEFIKQMIGEGYTFRFERMEPAYGFGYKYETVVDVILKDENETKKLIKILKEIKE